jgi:RND family efflux transporter MFP subunit
MKEIIKNIKKVVSWPIMRFKKLGRFGKAIVIVILLLVVYWRVNSYINSGIEVETQKASYGKLTESVSASGEIVAANSANLAFQTAGEVVEVNFSEGDLVKKGDIIAKLDTTTLYNNYKIAEATLRAAEASLDSTYDTLQGKEETETFAEISTRTTAETTKDKAYWAFVTAAKNLEGAYIKAPFDGVVTEIPDNLVPGSYVSIPTTSIFRVVGPNTVYFESEVSEVDINKLTSGQKAQVEIDAFPDEVFDGKVSGFNFSSTTTSTGGTAYVARITLPNNENKLFRLGMNGDADIIISETQDILLIPYTALVEEEGQSYVWVERGRKASKKPVEVGSSSINNIEVISGIEEGDKVIIRPPSTLEEGARVKN